VGGTSSPVPTSKVCRRGHFSSRPCAESRWTMGILECKLATGSDDYTHTHAQKPAIRTTLSSPFVDTNIESLNRSLARHRYTCFKSTALDPRMWGGGGGRRAIKGRDAHLGLGSQFSQVNDGLQYRGPSQATSYVIPLKNRWSGANGKRVWAGHRRWAPSR
jgi:hypothetical protein